MKHILKGLYIHRGKCINKCLYGWEIDNCLDIFRTLEDTKQYINKYEDGTNTKEPVIVGTISYDDTEKKLIYILNRP